MFTFYYFKLLNITLNLLAIHVCATISLEKKTKGSFEEKRRNLKMRVKGFVLLSNSDKAIIFIDF